MKRFTPFCMTLLMATLMAMVLVACGGAPTLDTTDAKAFDASLDVMYEELADPERADLLYYFPVVLYKNTVAEDLYRTLSRIPRFSDEKMLEEGDVTIETYKAIFQSLLDAQARGFSPRSGANLKDLNGATAAEITELGEAIMETYRQK